MNSIFEDIKNTFYKTGNGLNQVILINVAAFVVLILTKVFLTISGFAHIYNILTNYIFLPASIQDFIYKPWTLITYFFCHESFFHILFNMLFLYWFGMLIHEFLGSRRLINLYILGGLSGGLIYLLVYNTVPFFAQKAGYTALLGASGGVYAVVFGAATLLPDYTFFLMFLGPVKIKYIALFYLLLSIAESIGTNAGGNIAHLGGIAIGCLYIVQLRQGNDWGKPIEKIFAGINDMFKSKPKIKVTHRNTEPKKTIHTQGSAYEDVSQTEIDTILDKISKFGYEKLSKEEKQKLFKASQSTNI
ncbi:MAG: rhomboid family intramembrane serine protease [Cytophagales bacterium]|nr:rhomboid family intramembrane serine protease [Cytophagales bacterium]